MFELLTARGKIFVKWDYWVKAILTYEFFDNIKNCGKGSIVKSDFLKT